MASKKIKKHIAIRLYADDLRDLKFFAEGKEMTISGVIRHVIHQTIKTGKLKDMFR
ncbi:MAG: hypothetical protein ACYC2I_05795 [Elusimicrobiales bacterium]